ncbi:uncharacterized protein [Clytia hemisphaerica]|uniref:Uncharacterized protein n=1 Tax=Clytia hemisphaerica TaxID=252671 RepID=A0A7M5WY68_9CNID|eukprot:TCONS_00016139-protein
MPCCYNTTRSFVLFFLLIGLVGVVLAGVVDFWWKSDLQDKYGDAVTEEMGLWRTCGGISIISNIKHSSCIQRKSLFKFEEDVLDFNLDLILTGLVGGAFFTFVSLIMIAISMCQKYPSKVLMVFHLIFLLLGAAGGVFGLVWALIKVEDRTQDWAFYVLYGANGSLVLSFALSLILLCARAPGYYLVKRDDD